MNHYQKIAVTIFRIVSCCIAVYSMVSVFYSLVYVVLMSAEQIERGFLAAQLLSIITYLLVSIILYVLSKPLAYLIARTLNND